MSGQTSSVLELLCTAASSHGSNPMLLLWQPYGCSVLGLQQLTNRPSVWIYIGLSAFHGFYINPMHESWTRPVLLTSHGMGRTQAFPVALRLLLQSSWVLCYQIQPV